MKNIIDELYPMNRCLLGEGYDNALIWLRHLLPFEVLEFPSGIKLGTWTVPDEWVVRDAWVKFNGEKILDYKTQPLSLVVGSLPFHGEVDLSGLKQHLYSSEDRKNDTPYIFKYYEKDWGLCIPKSTPLYEGIYEVFIDTEYRPGVMKVGVHTIQGKLDKEILLLAHLDHPYQANDNLSGVACLVDLVTRLKSDYTIKLIICPETIGSIAYALTQDTSKVEFAISVDICGNKNPVLVNKSFNQEHKINRIAHLALHKLGEGHRKGTFRSLIGSDEGVFNDPDIGIAGIMLSTFPFPEYHTASDTPDKIDYEQISKVQDVVSHIIYIWEKDFIPKKHFKGFLMRSKYGIQTENKQTNMAWDYLIFAIDGKRTLAELCCEYGLDFYTVYDVMLQLENEKLISRVNTRQKSVKKTTK